MRIILFCGIAVLAAACANAPARVAKETPEELQSVPTRNLCLTYAMHNSSAVLVELRRRAEFSVSDLSLIEAHAIDVGMSADAAICSWAFKPYFTRSDGAGSHHLVYYKSNSSIFVQDGKVVNFQN